MKLSRNDLRLCLDISEEEGVVVSEVKKAVLSYFDSIVSETHKLPFDNPRRVYSKDAFDEKSFVVNLPYLGRIGPVYSRYTKWRSEEAKNNLTVKTHVVKETYRKKLVDEEAKKALSGQKVNIKLLKEGIPRGKYNRVWFFGGEGKRKLARQLIINENKK